jgi:hypothetical protein
MYDFLAPSSTPAIQLQGSRANVWLTPLGGCDKPHRHTFSFFFGREKRNLEEQSIPIYKDTVGDRMGTYVCTRMYSRVWVIMHRP